LERMLSLLRKIVRVGAVDPRAHARAQRTTCLRLQLAK
jgi:hypothetical protein